MILKNYYFKKKHLKKKYNFFIVDESNMFSLGLKKFIESVLKPENINSISTRSKILDINTFELRDVDVLFINDKDLKNPLLKNYCLVLKKNNNNLKIIITVNRLSELDLGLFSYDMSGFFSKGISKHSFRKYIYNLLKLGFYVDFETNNKIILKEKEQLKRHQQKFL